MDFLKLCEANVQLVSVKPKHPGIEKIICREPQWGKLIQLPMLRMDDTLVITLSHQGTAEITYNDIIQQTNSSAGVLKASIAGGVATKHPSRLVVGDARLLRKRTSYAHPQKLLVMLLTVLFLFLTWPSTVDSIWSCLGNKPTHWAKGWLGIDTSREIGARIHFDQVVIEDVLDVNVAASESLDTDLECGQTSKICAEMMGHNGNCAAVPCDQEELANIDEAGNITSTSTISYANSGSCEVFSMLDTGLCAWCCGLLILMQAGMYSKRVLAAEFQFMIIGEELQDEQIPKPPLKFFLGTINDGGDPEAWRRWRITYQWRLRNEIDTILTRPQKYFDVIKEFYPHFSCGKSKAGSMCYYERLGSIDIAALREHGVSVDDLVNYYTFMIEYTWNIQCPGDDGPGTKMVSVFDVKGVGLSDLGGDALAFLKATTKIAGDHYPERAVNIIVVNAPWIFSKIWGMISGLLPTATREKVRIAGAGKDTKDAMESLIALDQMPEEYGGTFRPGDVPGKDETYCRYNSPEEVSFRKFVHELNEKCGLGPPPYGYNQSQHEPQRAAQVVLTT